MRNAIGENTLVSYWSGLGTTINGLNFYRCANCGRVELIANYCGGCGAKMFKSREQFEQYCKIIELRVET